MDWVGSLRNLAVFYLFLLPCLCRGDTTEAPPPLPTSFECVFEINIFDAWCGITQNSNDDFDWQRKTSDDPDFTDPEPTVDHTTALVHGHYLYSAANINGYRGQLDMPDFAANTNPQCLEFFYQIGGDNAGQLNVYQWLSSSSMPSTPSWQMTGNTDDVWNRGLLTIAPQSDVYTVSFESVAGTNQKAYIALDDVKISDGECPYVNLSCTFEEGMCSIMQDSEDDQDWYRATGATSSLYTGPSVDHTLGTDQGYYIYIEASYLSIGESARVITPTLQGVSDGSPDTCLTFYYHMLGAGVGELKIYVVPLGSTRDDVEPSWVLSGNRGDKWRGAEVDITLPDDFTIEFEGVRGQTYEGDIALDDIDFRRGDSCPGHHKPPSDEPQVSCDFEEVEICGYEQNQTDDADWVWQNRAGSYSSAGPLHDHTNYDEFGFYMFLYGDVGHRVTAQLISPIVQLQGSHSCLQFWWYLYGNDDQSLSVYCVKDGKTMSDSFLLSMSGDYGPYWRRSRHEIPPDFTPCNLIFEGTTGIHNRDEIALDDVSVYESEQCPQNTYPVGTTTTPDTTTNVNCNFESTNDPMCGWTQSIQDGFDWIIHSGPTQDYNSGPEVDHTLNTDQGHFMLIDTFEDIPKNTRADMISPLITPSSSSRCFKFWYFMDGYNTDFLNVFIVPYGYTMPIDPNVQIYGDRGSQWLEGQMTVPSSTRSFYIIVEGTVSDTPYGADIAVDDFTMTNGMCTDASQIKYPFVANCNFESGICGYTQPEDDQVNEDEFDWFLNSGPTGTDGSGPSADHTLGTAAGHYLYMEASQPRRPGDRARIVSPVINYFNDTYCLEFFYHMSGDDTASLTVIQRGDYYTDQEIARLTGPDGTGWKPYNVDFGIKYGPIEIVFTGIVGNSYRGDIALDDITLTPGPCGGYPHSVSCNFEYGYQDCDFTQGTDDQLDWMWFDALTTVTPPTEWSGYGSFMYVDGSNRTSGDTAVLQSPMLSSGNNDHCFTFLCKLDDGMSLDFMSVTRDGSQKTLKSFTKSTRMTYTEYNIAASDISTDFKINIVATVQNGKKAGLAVVDNTFVHLGSCDSIRPVSSSSSATTVAIVMGILLGVAALVLLAIGILHYRNKSAKEESFPAAVSYSNGGSVKQPDLSKDPGIDNPNYTSANFSTA